MTENENFNSKEKYKAATNSKSDSIHTSLHKINDFFHR